MTIGTPKDYCKHGLPIASKYCSMTHPWWETGSLADFDYRIARLERAQYFCRGRAQDLRAHVIEHIAFLKQLRTEKFQGKE